MKSTFNRRDFVKTLLSGAASLSLPCPLARAASLDPFSFVLLGDLHFDKLAHHDIPWLQQDKPDDFRQVQNYSRITGEILPRLFATVRQTISDLSLSADSAVPFVIQVGDFVEGLCGRLELALQQNREAIDFVRQIRLGVPFLFTKGNHDITGEGAVEAFKEVFQPFLRDQMALL